MQCKTVLSVLTTNCMPVRSLFYCFVILQILLLRLYARRNRATAAVETTDAERPTSCDKPPEADHVDPLHSLDDATKQTFQVPWVDVVRFLYHLFVLCKSVCSCDTVTLFCFCSHHATYCLQLCDNLLSVCHTLDLCQSGWTVGMEALLSLAYICVTGWFGSSVNICHFITYNSPTNSGLCCFSSFFWHYHYVQPIVTVSNCWWC